MRITMAGYIIFGALTVWNIVMAIRERRRAAELYGHLSLAIFFGLLLATFLPRSNELLTTVFWTGHPGLGVPARGVGLSLVGVSIIPYLCSLRALRSRGTPKPGHHLETTRLVTSGIYRYVRHPMALAVFILGCGLMLLRLSPASIIAFTVLVICYKLLIQKDEEESLIEQFGEEYQAYRKRVPALNIILGFIRAR
jgi:protein-S-isoprenylcysteine O-methyltransferase Ste14